jgi:hypothetical protein
MVIFLILRQYIGARKHPVPIGVAVRTGKKNCETKFEYFWRTVSGQQCLLAEGDIGAPIYWRTEAPAPLLIIDENQFISQKN